MNNLLTVNTPLLSSLPGRLLSLPQQLSRVAGIRRGSSRSGAGLAGAAPLPHGLPSPGRNHRGAKIWFAESEVAAVE
uniref:Uncharacterized protein n=1 Tax=Arundo donax TaxID=35708 RepID=A0A0A9G9F9_ARUDO